uniref:Cadherin domain-containing protein n=1 Tax=Astatotilapia calliptera TaxID=8154 RepID=A0A3P8NT17_ASTCA
MIRICWPVFVLLLFVVQAVVTKAKSGDSLIRRKRAWLPPPLKLEENVDHTQKTSVARIHSDLDDGKGNLKYFLNGRGANQDPFHVFVVHERTGFIRVTQLLDREFISMYNLSGVARYNDGTLAEENIDVRFKVTDQNDNAPVFEDVYTGRVDELTPRGTFVMKVAATDADEPDNPNSQVFHTIIDQTPPHDMFYMNSDGSIFIKNKLDREKCDQYILTVKGQDLNGKPEGNTGTATVTIAVGDVNDNLPTLEKEQYEGSIEENTEGVEVMRIKAQDLDLQGTDNWEAVFDIVKGNEAGYFSIKTDPNTNEGILMLDKAVDYEDVKDIELGLSVRNKAQPYGSGTTAGISGGTPFKTYPIKINVKNQPEGAKFDPKVKAIHVSEGSTSFNIKDVIASYPAIDGDTRKPAQNVRYIKGFDPNNWLTIDPVTAEIKLNKMPDRESPHLVNGTYFAKILCVSEDTPDKTATGTIAIQVEDFNDHCPILTSNMETMCTTVDAVIVNANDEDAFPNGPPFVFEILPEGTKGKWQVEHLNDTAAILRSRESLWPGIYEVEFLVKDQQGHMCQDPQKVKVEVCTCEDGIMCGKKGAKGQPSKQAKLGPAGIGLLLLGLLLLLLIPLLLLFCKCGGAATFPDLFTEMPFDTKSHLINYHTERQGENTDVPLLNLPTQLDGDVLNVAMAQKPVAMDALGSFDFAQSVGSINRLNGANYQGSYRKEIWGMNQQDPSGFYSETETRESLGGVGLYDGMALPDHFLRQYYDQKVTDGNDNLGVKDGLLVYDYEGQGSSAGSVGCCSLLESDNDLQFLDNLGPKFKTLAEVCRGEKISYDDKQVPPPVSNVYNNPPASVSSSVSVQKLSPPPKLEPTMPKVEQSMVMKTTKHSEMAKESTTAVREGMNTMTRGLANQGQMVLIQQQQPVYYTTTPVLQPMHYVVQPQVQNTMILAEAPTTNLQGLILVNNTQSGPAQGVFVQGSTLLSSGQAQEPTMVLVDNSGAQRSHANLIQATNLSGSQTMKVVEGKVPAGSMKVRKGNQASYVEGGPLQPGDLPGSQKILMVRENFVQDANGLPKKAEVFGSERILYKDSQSTGSMTSKFGSSTVTVSAGPVSHKVQEKFT